MLTAFPLCPYIYHSKFSNFRFPLFPGSPMGRSYFDEFQRYGGKGSSRGYQSYNPPPRETPEEREARKARELERDRERYERDIMRASERVDRQEKNRGSDSSKRRKHDEGRQKSQEAEGHSKRSKVTHQSASDQPASSETIDPPSDAPTLQGTDIQAIFKRPAFSIPKGPPKLESQFPHWYLRGVRFDLDLVPINKDAMLRNLDAVKQDIERMGNWQKLVDELQRVNRCNHEAMLTMDNDKAEWEKILKEKDEEIGSLAAHNDQLGNRVKELEGEINASSIRHKQREEFLQNQVKDAHAAQAAVENQLVIEQKLSESYRNDISRLREKESKQTAEITVLQAKLARAEQEKDQALKEKAAALAEKTAAEEAHEKTRADINSDLFEFYVLSVMGKGSLSFLGPKYEITLAEVWERVLDVTKDSKYTEEELMQFYLDTDARLALAVGKEELAKERAASSGTEQSEKLVIHDSTASASTADITVASDQTAKILSAPAEGEIQITTEQASQEAVESWITSFSDCSVPLDAALSFASSSFPTARAWRASISR